MLPTTLLRRAEHVEVRLSGNALAEVRAGGDSLRCSTRVLRVLELFAQPHTVADAMDVLGGVGVEDFVETSGLILQLARIGVLEPPDGAEKRAPQPGAGFESAAVHVAMLGDTARTEAWLRGIREVVRPGDVVVEIGTGTGVLAVAAAQAGAARVWALEEGRVAALARRVVADNGLTERVQVIERRSTSAALPETGDVLVSEIIGDDPLAEHVVELTRDARRRLVRADARGVPSRISVYALPVDVPPEFLRDHVFCAENVAAWGARYAMRLDELRAGEAQLTPSFVLPQRARAWPVLGAPITLADVDLLRAPETPLDVAFDVPVDLGSATPALLVYFEAVLGPTTRFSTHPAAASDANHWRSPLWILPRAQQSSPSSPPGLARPLRLVCAWRGGRAALRVE